jgi:hypothetical protein
MSVKKTTSKIVLLSIVGASLGGLGMHSYRATHTMQRELASSPVSSSKWRPLPLGKHLATINTEIEKLESIPDSSDQEVTLTGYVYVRQQLFSDVEYKWVLPPEVKIVSGQISDGLANTKSGDVIKVQISVTGFSKEMQSTVTLTASTSQDGIPVGSSSVISSKPEETWDGVAQEMKKSAEEQLQENAVKVK